MTNPSSPIKSSISILKRCLSYLTEAWSRCCAKFLSCFKSSNQNKDDKKNVNLETTLGEMLPIFKASNKEQITFKELLSHYGRMQAWIPFYKATVDSVKIPMEIYYR